MSIKNFKESLTLSISYTLPDDLRFETQFAPELVTERYLRSFLLKTLSMKNVRQSINLSCGILVYRVEKSKVEMDSALFLALIRSKALQNSVLLSITQKIF